MTMTTTCQCTGRHSPAVLEENVHHVVPRAWGGTDTTPDTWGTVDAPSNRVVLCPNAHTAAHSILNLAVHLGRMPTHAEVAQRYGASPSAYIWTVARTGWDHRPDGKLPFTLTHDPTHVEP